MPSVVEKGTHAYRPSTQSQGLARSFLAKPDNLNNISDESETELQPILPSPATSPPAFPFPSPSTSAAAFISNNLSSLGPSASASTPASLNAAGLSGKRKRSAVDDESLLFAPPSQAASGSRSRISPGAMALQGIKGQMENFNDTMRNRPTESQHKTNAMRILHELELDDGPLIAMMEVFKNDADAADMFVSMQRESTRKTWVKAQLAGKGFNTDIFPNTNS